MFWKEGNNFQCLPLPWQSRWWERWHWYYGQGHKTTKYVRFAFLKLIVISIVSKHTFTSLQFMMSSISWTANLMYASEVWKAFWQQMFCQLAKSLELFYHILFNIRILKRTSENLSSADLYQKIPKGHSEGLLWFKGWNLNCNNGSKVSFAVKWHKLRPQYAGRGQCLWQCFFSERGKCQV